MRTGRCRAGQGRALVDRAAIIARPCRYKFMGKDPHSSTMPSSLKASLRSPSSFVAILGLLFHVGRGRGNPPGAEAGSTTGLPIFGVDT